MQNTYKKFLAHPLFGPALLIVLLSRQPVSLCTIQSAMLS